jgi:predicted glycogen debranching enzyme
MITLGRDLCGQFDIASRQEWLETNGIGGYASGTVAGVHTRAYHALLVAATQIPLGRLIMLSQLEEFVIYNGQKFPLSANQYRNAMNPQGYLHLEEFRLDPFPVLIYRCADLRVEKRIFMAHGHNLTWVLYRLLSPAESEVQLLVRPQVNFRSLHLHKRERRFLNTHHDLAEHVVHLIPDGALPTLNLYHNAAAFEHSSMWYQDLYYREEDERGLDCQEDLFSPGTLRFLLKPEADAFLAATTETLVNPNPEAAAADEIARRRGLTEGLAPTDEFTRQLLLAADQFLVQRGDGLSVIAGYPWLVDSGRDAMVSLPGLTLATGWYSQARFLLATYAGYCQEGLLPNHFSEENNQPMYNTVDAALWFMHAVHQYLAATGDKNFVRKKLWVTLTEIVDFYIKGTYYRVRMDDDGLINLPEEAAQLTWMDAQVGDWIVTPRSGKPVEVNALWHNALCIMRDLAGDFGEQDAQVRYAALAAKAQESFLPLFWNEKGGYLFDRVEDNFQDPTLRPNQLLAISLPHPLLTGDRAKQVLSVVRRELYTTFGLRTLNPSNEHYEGTYQGDVLSRESSAHQGTVWPWLLGAYADALLNVHGRTDAVKQELSYLIAPFVAHLRQVGLGTISEMFDGNPPHMARGCCARAWSVAEILRIQRELVKA